MLTLHGVFVDLETSVPAYISLQFVMFAKN